MKFLLLIYMEENAMNQAQRDACYAKSAGIACDLHSQGKLLGTAPLQPGKTAKSIRIREGKRMITDGPFAETRELLGGFFLVDAEDQNEALEIAAKLPGVNFGTVEVRPVLEIQGLPGATGA